MASRTGRVIVRWVVVALSVVLVGAGAYVAYGLVTRPAVMVTQAVQGPVVEAFYATGTLSPEREYPINSNVEGTVTEVAVDKGSAVTAGQKLAFVHDEAYELRYRQARADLELRQALADEQTPPTLREFDDRIQAATEQLAIAQRELERLAELRRTQSASESDFDRTNQRVQGFWSDVQSLKARRATHKLELQRDVAVAQAALDIAQWNLDQQTVRSPVDGMVLDRPVSLGTRVRVNDHLMQVADASPGALVMRAAVDEEDKTRLRPEQAVKLTLYAYPRRVFDARIKRIYPKADPERRTFEVDVEVATVDEGFAAGMTGELAFIVQAKDGATVVPSQAVQAGGVWVVRGGKLARPTVEMGLRSIERTEIVSGLEPTDLVVISPAGTLAEGEAVRTRYVDPKAAADLNRPAEAANDGFRGFN